MTDATMELFNYLTSAGAHEIWMAQSGFLTRTWVLMLRLTQRRAAWSGRNPGERNHVPLRRL